MTVRTDSSHSRSMLCRAHLAQFAAALGISITVTAASAGGADSQPTVAVTTDAELASALRRMPQGGSIVVKPSSRKLILRNLNPSAPVTISGQGAVLNSLLIEKSSRINLVNFELVAIHANGTDPFKVLDSSHISLDKLNIHGSLDNDPSNDTSAVQIRRSNNIILKRSRLHELANAVTHLDSDNITFSNNYFHNIRMDGIRGGGSSNVVIEENYFTDFKPLPADHPDAIQFWNTNTTKSAENIIIRDNLIARGDGGPAQGIFVTAQISRLKYKHVNIIRNVVIGSLYHGITVSGADDVNVKQNTILTFRDIGARLSIDRSTNIDMHSNRAPTYLLGKENVFVINKDNKKSGLSKDNGASLIKDWLNQRPDHPANS